MGIWDGAPSTAGSSVICAHMSHNCYLILEKVCAFVCFASKLSAIVLIMLINVKMPTIVGILIFISLHLLV